MADCGELSNAVIGELLCLAAQEPGRSDQQRRALRRAGRAAWRWSVDAIELVRGGESLTQLPLVGPWTAAIIHAWITDPPPLPEPPPMRRGFLTRVEVDRILQSAPRGGAVRGDLQMHTVDSDGTESIAAMATAAAQRGLSYVAITDHSRGLAIANGMGEEQLAAQGERIRRLNAGAGESGVRILRGVEMNLSPDGSGDLDPQFLATLDIVLGAFHSRLRVADDQTERYLRALRNPSVHVLAHPRGRIFNHRLGLWADWRRVFECARDRDRAIEIDGYPDRQDVDGELLELARDTNVRISLGSDAHAASQLAFLDYSIAGALRAGIAEERIINCMDADALVAWTRTLH